MTPEIFTQPVYDLTIETPPPINLTLGQTEINEAIAAHEQELDPHSQYAKDTDLPVAATAAIAAHEQKLDPHPQYAKDSDLATHASDSTLHLHDGAIANNQVASNAAIAWGKIDKTGAAAGDVGAATSGHTHSGLAIESATAPSNPATGQRWRDTNDWLVWYWSGQYWLSEQIYALGVSGSTYTTASNPCFLVPNPSYNFFFLDWRWGGLFNFPQNATAYWNFTIQRVASGTTGAVIVVSGSLNTSDVLISSGVWAGSKSETLNIHQDVVALSVGYYRFTLSLVGSPGSTTASFLLRYRLAKR